MRFAFVSAHFHGRDRVSPRELHVRRNCLSSLLVLDIFRVALLLHSAFGRAETDHDSSPAAVMRSGLVLAGKSLVMLTGICDLVNLLDGLHVEACFQHSPFLSQVSEVRSVPSRVATVPARYNHAHAKPSVQGVAWN